NETPNPKHQAPEKSRNRNTKNQAPNTKEIPSSKPQTTARASSLEFGASLVFGAWDLDLLWSLVFGALIGAHSFVAERGRRHSVEPVLFLVSLLRTAQYSHSYRWRGSCSLVFDWSFEFRWPTRADAKRAPQAALPK